MIKESGGFYGDENGILDS